MELSYFVAKLGWGSIFALLWLKTFGYLNGQTGSIVVTFLIFGGITVLATAYYSYAKYTKWQFMRRYGK